MTGREIVVNLQGVAQKNEKWGGKACKLLLPRKLVLTTAHKAGIPVAVVMGGGYAPDIDVIVQAHMGVFGVARGLLG